MMPHRYFTTEVWPGEGRAVLRGPDAHHLARVMRARAGPLPGAGGGSVRPGVGPV